MEGIDIYDIKRLRLDKKPRPIQKELLNFSVKAVKNNKKYIIVEAPTGTGKSYYACMFMDWFKKEYDVSAQFDILTNSKILQEQYTNDYDFINSLWGKGSYYCEQYQCDCSTGSEWAKLQNKKCSNCPYSIAKYRFENGDVALTNYHLFLTYLIYMPQAWKRTSRVLVIDETHELEQVFCDFVLTQFSKPLLKRNGFNDYEVENLFKEFDPDMQMEQFINFIENRAIPIAKSVYARLVRESEEDKNAIKTSQALIGHVQKWELLCREWGDDPTNWILEREKVEREGSKKKDWYWQLTAQPIWSYKYLAENLWPRYDYVVLMSGTILDKDLFCQMNGIDPSDAAFIAIDSPFPVENRPIYFFSKIGKQSYKTKDIVWPKQKEIVDKIMKKYKSDKGIIHSGNYELASWTIRDVKEGSRLLAHKSNDRSQIVQEHYNSSEPTVLVSPSLMTGLDLKDEYSRFQVVLKMPYPNLGSEKVKKRMETMKDYYGLTTVRTLIQAYGRSVRSMDDWADTYILDGCFADILKWSGHWIPKWIKDAIKWIN